MKIVFFGTSNVALPILEALNRQHTIAAVVTQPDATVGRKKEITESPVSVLAREMELVIFKPAVLKDNAEFFDQLQLLAADLYVVVSYGKIIPKNILELPVHKTLNIHFSLLPQYRGASPIQSALINGDTETGTSIMVLDELLDHGPIIASEKYPVDADDNFITLSEKLAHVSARLIERVLPDYISGSLIPIEQNHAAATFTTIITKEDGRADWTKSAQQLYNQFRAFYPWPGLFTTWDGKLLKITDCMPVVAAGTAPGSVGEGGVVGAGGGTALQILRLQLEGKNETDIHSFLNGYQNFPGGQLL